MQETFNPGYCTIESADLITAEGETKSLTGLIGRFDLQQAMSSSTITGSIDVLDGLEEVTQ